MFFVTKKKYNETIKYYQNKIKEIREEEKKIRMKMAESKFTSFDLSSFMVADVATTGTENVYVCSYCQKTFKSEFDRYDFCPHCGAVLSYDVDEWGSLCEEN